MTISDKQFANVLIPMVRRVIPNLIAQDICGVQPMTGPTNIPLMTGEMEDQYHTILYWVTPKGGTTIFSLRVRYDVDTAVEEDSYINWCIDTFGPEHGKWWRDSNDGKFIFRTESDRLAFVLKWQ